MSNRTVFQMVHEVLADAKEKLASDPAAHQPSESQAGHYEEKTASAHYGVEEDALKVAEALDFLAEHIHEVGDDRSAREKLAEYAAIHDAIMKQAEGEDPTHPSLDSGVNPGGPSSAMKAEETNTPGTSLDAGESGVATQGHQTPRMPVPSEKPNPADASNAMETNEGMMMPEQSERILKQAMAENPQAVEVLDHLVSTGLVTKQAAMGALSKEAATYEHPSEYMTGGETLGQVGRVMGPTVLGGLTGAGLGALAGRTPMARELGAIAGGQLGAGAGLIGGALWAGQHGKAMKPELMKRQMLAEAEARKALAKESSVPEHLARAMLKMSQDDSSEISSGTTPILQSSPDANPAQMQGSEAGQMTPRETAPTSGEGGGRHLVSSVEAAINATKGQAKAQNKGALSQVLTEPAMSAAHDKTLQKSLDNTSNAGVKISAARELLKKWASSSPENQRVLRDAVVKLAQPPADPAAAPPPPPAPVGGGVPGAAPAPGAEAGMAAAAAPAAPAPVSDEALEAAAEGVTPEQLAQAQELLDAQAAQAAAADEAAAAQAPAQVQPAPAPAAAPPAQA